MKKIIYLIIFILLLTSAYAVTRDMNIQIGKAFLNKQLIEDSTIEINFSLWTSYTGDTPVFIIEKNISVHNGTGDVIISPNEEIFINNSNIFLSVTIATDNESIPRVNLTSVPYSIRSNITDSVRENSITNKSIFNTGNFSFFNIFVNSLLSTNNIISLGSINSSFDVNATRIFQNYNQVQTINAIWNFVNNESLVLDNSTIIRTGNLSILNTLTNYIRVSDFNLVKNISNNTIGRAELDNVTVIRTENLTTLNTLDNYIRIKDFSLNNVSNFTNMPFSNFRLENVSNNTIGRNENRTIGNFNFSTSNLPASYLYPFDSTYNILLGDFNASLNWTDKLVVIGSVRINGSLGATTINSTNIYQNGNRVNDSVDLSLYNKSISLVLYNQSVSLNLYNQSVQLKDYIVGTNRSFVLDMLDNSTVNRSISLSLYNQSISLVLYNQSVDLSGYVLLIGAPFSNFQLGNVSNDTLKISQNSTVSLWNKTGRANITLNLAEALILGNINITGANNISANFFTGEIACGGIRFNDGGLGNTAICDGTDASGGADASAYNNLNNATNYTVNYPNIDLTTLDDFNVANNATNNTLVKGDNITLSLWNTTSNVFSIYTPRDFNAIVRIGWINESLGNWTLDKLSVEGSVAVYGSLNATFFNASKLFQGVNQVQTINAVYNSVNFTSNYDARTDRFLNLNFTTLYDARTDRFSIQNGTALPFSNFGLGNVSNHTNKLTNSSPILSTGINITRPTDGASGLNGTIWIGNLTIMSNGSDICIPRC